MSDCLFCKIVNGDIPSEQVYSDDKVIAFKDIQPQAPVHYIVIPRKHIETMNDVMESDSDLMSSLLLTCQQLAKQENLSDRGYRIVINCNKDGGQSVFHLHAHLLGGRHMTWPPG